MVDKRYREWVGQSLAKTAHIPHDTPHQFFVVDYRDHDEINSIVPAHESCITFRCDSDDFYLGSAFDLGELISRGLPDGRLVNFPHGFQIDARPRSKNAGKVSYLPLRVQVCSPFVALTTRGNNITDIYSENHGDMQKKYPIAASVLTPSWVQVIHGTNLLNRYRDINLPESLAVSPPDQHIIDRIMAATGDWKK